MPRLRANRHELPPLRMRDLVINDLLISDDPLGGVATEGGFRTNCQMELTFNRKYRKYFAWYAFGVAITADSDQMVRIGTLALRRLLLRCGSFRACYAQLDEAGAAALRKKVADPRGIAGLEFEDTGHNSLLSLARACREDGWVLDAAALNRPLFPAVDAATGMLLFTESFQVEQICKRLAEMGVKLGMNKHAVGAWSFVKDATEAPFAAGDPEVAARVRAHREANAGTRDIVFRADLTTRDLGAYWMRRSPMESVSRSPLSPLSASRVPEASGVRSLADLPATCPELHAQLDGCAAVAAAKAELDSARRKLQELLGVAELPRYHKTAAQAAGLAEEAAAYEGAQTRLRKRVHEARERAVEAYRLRVYREGQERLRTTPSLRHAMMSTHAWAPRSEDEAIAFGLDRRDRTRELRWLRELPAVMQGSILRVGALHVLPRERMRRTVYEHVRERCTSEGLCSLECGSEQCAADGLTIPWPDSAKGFEALRCERCGDKQVRLRWRRQTSAAAAAALVADEQLAAGATEALGASFAESFGVWHTLCGRAAIGNAAYDAGAAATVETLADARPDLLSGEMADELVEAGAEASPAALNADDVLELLR